MARGRGPKCCVTFVAASVLNIAYHSCCFFCLFFQKEWLKIASFWRGLDIQYITLVWSQDGCHTVLPYINCQRNKNFSAKFGWDESMKKNFPLLFSAHQFSFLLREWQIKHWGTFISFNSLKLHFCRREKFWSCASILVGASWNQPVSRLLLQLKYDWLVAAACPAHGHTNSQRRAVCHC